MSFEFKLSLETRADKGKGASRRLRHSDMVPGIVYGDGKDPISVSMAHKDLAYQLNNEAFYSHILDVTIDGGKAENVVLKDLQRHPSKPRLLHFDLMRVNAKEKITMHVPIHVTGEDVAPGVKTQGGSVSHNTIDIEISCLPKDLPEFLTVDISTLNVGEAAHLSDVKVPEGVTVVALTHGAEHDQPVVSIHLPRGAKEEDDAGATDGVASEGDTAAE
ncbi:MAG: 50S ribosomal protein L25/general stress protein Ctc [Gammaproteobacteria bacterium]|nr:50S ribosomal protein L25/general stress protein Ctc [Gammaproteobacteria bacterium]PCH64693.1 MAG: 50S ribosomal protein L25/general stress protein Ctc [Gammaproteobacteria bacterium]